MSRGYKGQAGLIRLQLAQKGATPYRDLGETLNLMARFFFPGQPTAEQVERILSLLLNGVALSSADILAMGIASPRMVIHTLRHKLGVPVATMELVEENNARAVELAEDFEPDYREDTGSEEPDAPAAKYCIYMLTASEIKRFKEDRDGQAKDYFEIIRLNALRRVNRITAVTLRSKGEPVPESVQHDAALKVPGNTEGTSRFNNVISAYFKQHPLAANDAEYQVTANKKGDQ
ncbi:hypothetical protein ID866_12485 [Astraeus odoratus]|nr:hypothetical protein ID866_12485 [Astraeus odoratus]